MNRQTINDEDKEIRIRDLDEVAAELRESANEIHARVDQLETAYVVTQHLMDLKFTI